jgi:hypothetical protein
MRKVQIEGRPAVAGNLGGAGAGAGGGVDIAGSDDLPPLAAGNDADIFERIEQDAVAESPLIKQ